ncbi:hypothetical protein H1S01_18890 [Heliobacterium chlorum]|uniref:Cardiolipin synthase N-terminal domain-containing protein n=1 Tax=Heliobacterium chlorum TaxID=2698 RepID=A0ABR7T808_HELCL|nr:hypothetical protein [Heliobacterium chlorum]MBC9786525.1 hypothetical protein [Heliobacterium chlorum]
MSELALALVVIIYPLFFTFLLVTHISVCSIVYKDAKRLGYSALNISPFLWGSISFILPIFGMVIYWLMNHSSLAKPRD